jgi:hypothetical protein
MRTSDEILIKSMFILADDIQSDDGVANAAIREAAFRLDEQKKEIEALKKELEEYRSLAEKMGAG